MEAVWDSRLSYRGKRAQSVVGNIHFLYAWWVRRFPLLVFDIDRAIRVK
jgi:hypothetical protein